MLRYTKPFFEPTLKCVWISVRNTQTDLPLDFFLSHASPFNCFGMCGN